MGKPTTNWPSDSAITLFPRDGEWHPENAALQQAAGDSRALADFYCAQQKIEIEIRGYERRYQETREPIAEREAGALAKRIKNLRLYQSFDGREDFIKFLAGKCLTLKEGQAAGEVYAVVARLEAVNIPQWCGKWWSVTLAIPAELQVAGPDPTFGVQTFQWLRQRCEPLVRELAIRGFPPGSPVSRMFDDGGFAIVGGLTRPDLDAVPVVPAPIETTIAEYVKHAGSDPDHWDALVKAAAILRRSRQPFGEALSDWLVMAADRQARRPKATKAAKAPANALRNHAIVEAVRALERCGIPPTRNRDGRWLTRAHGWEGGIDPDYNPPSGCAIVAEAFGMQATAVEKILS